MKMTRIAGCVTLMFVLTFIGSASAEYVVPTNYVYVTAPPASGNYSDAAATKLSDLFAGSVVVWPGSANVTPLVGWENLDPTITFNFDGNVDISEVVVFAADSDNSAGVNLPTSITLSTSGGFSQAFSVENPPGDSRTVPIRLSGFSVTTDDLTVTMNRNTVGSWTMVSQIDCFDTSMPYKDAIVRQTPIAYWNFDESGLTSNAVDLIGGATLAAQGDATRVARGGGYGSAADLSGGASSRFYNATTGIAGLSGGGEIWAVEMWLQAQGDATIVRNDYPADFGGSPGANPAFLYGYTPGIYEMYRPGGTVPRTGGTGTAVTDNDWHHLMWVCYGNNASHGVTNRQDIWVDGVKSTYYTDISTGFGQGTISLGTAYNGSAGFEGRIDEVAIWDVNAANEGGAVYGDLEDLAMGEAFVSNVLTHLRAADLDVNWHSADSYSLNAGSPDASFPDTEGVELCDGVIGRGTYNTCYEYTGFNATMPEIVFDLGRDALIDAVEINYLVDSDQGVHAPDSVGISFSLDDSSYGSVTTYKGFNDRVDNAGEPRSTTLDLSNERGRYIKMTFSSDATWLMLSEVRFATVPSLQGTVILVL